MIVIVAVKVTRKWKLTKKRLKTPQFVQYIKMVRLKHHRFVTIPSVSFKLATTHLWL